jgi:RNA polymerase sigma-70 factor (ECF subfamily)
MEFQDLSADSLVQLVRDGQVAAFGAIVTRYQLDVMRKVNLLLLDKVAVEDMVQEVFVRAYTRLDQYRLGTSFRNWLIGITKNTVLQELRRSKRYTGRLTRYADMVENRLRTQEAEEDDERATALLDCLQRLDARSAELVRARYAESLGIDEIAEAAGRTVGSVRTLLYRARSQLRGCLEKKGTWR